MKRARELLEVTDLLVEEVARRSGVGSTDSLRERLVLEVGRTPSRNRALFRRVLA